ncbi:hypothetical protein DMB66_02430 [Actinoplanes sp. ATCC 53533]|uniref:hypothetical protein n=1 Tax=Actinoplanes sp. ATCC 53533 TaxID=1288362 RepID=UPI000F771BA5|nr:hypothetical protein [Actinoplanes sp. ATCC 53533]RSM74282.1 hypothetical protein DMB66_02430 [Actinoplanes sp. ATCC 53533]
MSYGTFARQVRDSSLPDGVRLAAFKGCLERYCPIGYEASFRYLKLSVGPFERDPDALLRALVMLTASRDLWLVAQAAYAENRRTAKRSGRRTPAKNEPQPGGHWLWLGAERAAALFALEHEYSRRGAPEASLGSLVERTLTTRGVLDAADRTLLDQLRADVDHYRTRGFDWEKPDWQSWHRSSDALRLLAHVRNAAYARN